MKKIMTVLIMMGFVGLTACASNEATMESAENESDSAKDNSAAAMQEASTTADKAEDVISSDTADAQASMSTEAEEKAGDAMASGAAADASAGDAMVTEASAADMASNTKVSVCKNAGHVRTITLVYDDEETGKACKVDYEKSSGTQTLWTANTDKDYCLEKAEAFVQKQEGWGWDCTPLQ